MEYILHCAKLAHKGVLLLLLLSLSDKGDEVSSTEMIAIK
jgi:hypothetical protein